MKLIGVVIYLTAILGVNAQDSILQTYSLSGKPLYSTVNLEKVRKRDSVFNSIVRDYKLTEDDFIGRGKRLAAEGQYTDAIVYFSKGLEQFPKSFKLLRHRGHRYLTLRQLDLAEADLLKARELMKDQPDVMDDYKLPYQHQIEYHLGLCYFFKKNYKEAVNAFEKALREAHEANRVVVTTEWLYQAYLRNGQRPEADKLLFEFTPTGSMDKGQANFRVLLLFKGLLQPREVGDETIAVDKLSIQDITGMYGVANFYAYHGNKEKAIALYEKILLADKRWPAFAYLASEVEMK